MPIAVVCHRCKSTYQVKERLAGQKIHCKACNEVLTVPGGAAPAPSPAVRPGPPKPDRVRAAIPVTRPAREDDDDFDEDDDDFPRKRRRRRRSNRASSTPLVLALVGGGVAVLVIVVVLVLLLRRGPDPAAIMAAGPPQAPFVPAQQPPIQPFQPAAPRQPPQPPPPLIKLQPAAPIAPLPAPPAKPLDPVVANPNQIVLESFEQVVFSRTPSRIVAVASRPGFKETVYRVFDVEKRKLIAEHRVAERWDHAVLNGDGTMIAGRGPFVGKTIDILTADGVRSVGPVERRGRNGFFDFTSSGKLFVVEDQFPDKSKYQLFDIAKGQAVLANLGPHEDEHSGISPDRQFYAAVASRIVIVRNLETLQPLRQLPIPPKTKSFFFQVEGVAFSPDGKYIAALVNEERKGRLLYWDWQAGKLQSDFGFDHELKRPFASGDEVTGLEWMPDGNGWLAQGETLIDRKTGKELMKLPAVAEEWKKGVHRFVDPNTILVAKKWNGNQNSLELVALKRDEIDSALEIAEKGGDPNASRLPPLAAANLGGVRELTVAANAGWKGPVEAADAPLPAPNFNVQGAAEDVQQLFVNRGQAAVVSLVSPDGQGVKNKVRVERIDLRNGQSLDRVELYHASVKMGSMDHLPMPHTARFVGDFDGTSKFIALREPADKKRVDVWTFPGKYVIGLAPFANDADPLVHWTAVVDDLLLTANGRTLVAWRLPEGKAVFRLMGPFVPGSFAFSPSRKHLAVLSGRHFAVLDPKTGETIGKLALPDDAASSRVATAAFRPDGKAFAAMIPEMRDGPPGFSLEQIVFSFGGENKLVRWNLDTGAVEQSLSLSQPPGRLQWVGPNYVVAGSYVIDWKQGDAVAHLGTFPNSHRLTHHSQDWRLWFVMGAGNAARLVSQKLPDDEAVRIAKAIAEKRIERAFGSGDPIALTIEGAVAPPALEQLKANLARQRHAVVDGSRVTLRVSVQEGGAPSIKIREIGAGPPRITEVPGLSIKIEATLRDDRDELWKRNHSASTHQGIGIIRTDDLTQYFHKPVRDGAEAWIRSLRLPGEIIRENGKLVPYPRTIQLVGDGA
jgi:WD40 repeat protein